MHRSMGILEFGYVILASNNFGLSETLCPLISSQKKQRPVIVSVNTYGFRSNMSCCSKVWLKNFLLQKINFIGIFVDPQEILSSIFWYNHIM